MYGHHNETYCTGMLDAGNAPSRATPRHPRARASKTRLAAPRPLNLSAGVSVAVCLYIQSA